MESYTFEDSLQEFSVSIGVRTPIIFLVSFLVIVSNVLNIVILSTRIKNIPEISRICLLNLCVVDLCNGIVVCAPCVVPAILGHWPYGAVWCQIAGMMHGVCATVSMWTLAIISLDRYIAVVKPLRYPLLVTARRCYVTLVMAWVIAAVLFASLIFTKKDFIYYKFNYTEGVCGMNFENRLFCIITSIPIPVLTASAIVYTTVRMVKELSHSISRAANVKPIKILVLTAAMYILCWGPYCTATLIRSFDPNVYPPREVQFVFIWMGNGNSFVNVLIYSAIYKRFRQHVKVIVKSVVCFCCKSPDVPSMTSSVSQIQELGTGMATY